MKNLNKTFVFLLCFCFCIPLFAKDKQGESPSSTAYATRKNYYGATSARDLDLLAQYEAQRNTGAIKRMVEENRLIPLGDEEVNVAYASPSYGTVIQVRSKKTAKTYWTVKEALIGGEKVVTVDRK